MKILRMTLGSVSTNCFIVLNDSGEALVIDPSADGERIIEVINENHVRLTKILLTHGHFDHIGGAYYLQTHTDAKLYIHEADNEFLNDPNKNLSKMFQQVVCDAYTKVKADELLKDGDVVEFGECSFSVMHTPGHSQGSCMFITNGVIFSGDTLFKGEIGRNDTYGGSWEMQQKSLAKIAQIPGEYTICCGHGENTTLAYERQHNPYLKV